MGKPYKFIVAVILTLFALLGINRSAVTACIPSRGVVEVFATGNTLFISIACSIVGMSTVVYYLRGGRKHMYKMLYVTTILMILGILGYFLSIEACSVGLS